jgi:hypothetical protein
VKEDNTSLRAAATVVKKLSYPRKRARFPQKLAPCNTFPISSVVTPILPVAQAPRLGDIHDSFSFLHLLLPTFNQ